LTIIVLEVAATTLEVLEVAAQNRKYWKWAPRNNDWKYKKWPPRKRRCRHREPKESL